MDYPPILRNGAKRNGDGMPFEDVSDTKSDSSASDATLSEAPRLYRNASQKKGAQQRSTDDEMQYDSDEYEDADPLDLDEEEQIGLMQMDRDARKGTGVEKDDRRNPSQSHTRKLSGKPTTACRGCMIFSLIIFIILAAVPLVRWLGSTSYAYSMEQEAKKMQEAPYNSNPRLGLPKDPDSLEVILPFVDKDKFAGGRLKPIEKYKPSSNDLSGNYGLKRAAPVFSNVDRVFPGWGTGAQAADAFVLFNQTGFDDESKQQAQLDVDTVNSLRALGKKRLRDLTMDVLFNGQFMAQGADINWSAEDPDEGVFTYIEDGTGNLIVEDVTHKKVEKTGEGQVAPGGGKVTLVHGSDLKDSKGNPLRFDKYLISPDMRFVLLQTDRVKQWRYSSHYNVLLFDVMNKIAIPVGADGGTSIPPVISNVAFAPAPIGSPGPPTLAFVSNNDLYILPTPQSAPIRITEDGAESIFNAVPDWVYEEEVYGSDSAMWFSPDGSKLAYLRLDETKVPIYEYPVYNPNKWMPGQTTPYLSSVKMKYPKPGYPNPVTTLHVVDVAALKQSDNAPNADQLSKAKVELVAPSPGTGLSADDADVDDALAGSKNKINERLVTEVVWTGNNDLLMRESNRISDRARVVHFNLASFPVEAKLQGKVARRVSVVKEGGWVEVAQTMQRTGQGTSYVEVVPNADGFRQIAMFASADSSEPKFLTKGEWEVAGTVSHVDSKRGKIYFIGAYPNPGERHLFSVDLPSSDKLSTHAPQSPKAVTGTIHGGTDAVSFDPKGAYFLISSQSPGRVPEHRVLGVDRDFELVLQDNRALARLSAQYVKPTALFYNITINDVVISIKELRPYDFDSSGRTKYPVLVNVYGGPNSQMVAQRWERSNWHDYLACEMGYIVITIDGRGTGFKGRKYRNPVTSHLGAIEAQDVTDAAAQIARLAYVDERRIGVWGWSFGGYLTSKLIERDSGVFNLGMSVAPVTSWTYYDSIYTERYMKTPSLNPSGYENSSVHVTDGFRHSHFLLAQGSGDDNVHFEHSAHLLDLLTGSQVRGFRFRMFTDSDHSISTRGAYQELHEFMLSFLAEKWGSGGRRLLKWKKPVSQ